MGSFKGRSPGGRDSAGASRLCCAADGFGHPQDFLFCGLSHEEEGQGVTGEVEEAFPVPGGIGLGVRDEGRGREVRREDGAEPVYCPARAWRACAAYLWRRRGW